MKIIKEIRRERGMSQAELAAKSGLSQSFVSRLERGETDVSATNLMDIALALGVRTSDLLDPDSAQGRLFRALDRFPPDQHAAIAEMLERLAASFLKEPPADE